MRMSDGPVLSEDALLSVAKMSFLWELFHFLPQTSLTFCLFVSSLFLFSVKNK